MDHRTFVGGIALALGTALATSPALAAQSVDLDSVAYQEGDRGGKPAA